MHLFIRLAASLTLPRTIARLKAKTRISLDTINAKWQPNFYEHRLRPDDPVEDVVRYIHLDPYRARLLDENGTYPWFRLGAEEQKWFTPMTDMGSPFPEWLR